MEPRKKKILVVRHGESVWNVLRKQYPSEEERYHERMWTIDCDITDLGIEQAREAGENLASQISSIDLLIVSPLRRALQTAKFALERFPTEPTKVVISKDAAEIMLDACDIGSSPDRLSEKFPQWDFSHLSKHWWHGGLSQEETLARMKDRIGLETDEDTEARVETFVNYLQEINGGNIVIVCHGDLTWWLTRQLQKNGEWSGQKLQNGEIVDITRFIHP